VTRAFVVFAAALATLAALTYFGSALWIFRQVQPYRHVLPLAFFAVIPAAAALEAAVRRGCSRGRRGRSGWRWSCWRSRRPSTWPATCCTTLPKSLPEVAPMYNGGWNPITTQGFGPQPDYRQRARTKEDDGVPTWVRSVDDGQARFVVEDPTLGEKLAWRTDAHILGGFIYRNLQHSHANLFRRRKQGVASDAELRAYFETYAVGWVILSNPSPAWDRRPESSSRSRKFGGHRMYRTKGRAVAAGRRDRYGDGRDQPSSA
jgi:hypothetical protein